MAAARSSAARAARVRLAATLAVEATCCTVAAVCFRRARSRSRSSATPARQTSCSDSDCDMASLSCVEHQAAGHGKDFVHPLLQMLHAEDRHET